MQEPQQRKVGETRDRILEAAEAAILEKGFAGTSIDELIAAVGITKSGFFYHFKDKNQLTRALLVRYVEREDELFDDLFRRADELNEDPLHGFLVGLKMLSEMLADLRAHIDDIDFAAADRYEREKRHDVMAHILTYGDAAPRAREIIHLGATSCFVTDNTDLLLMRQGLEMIADR